MNDAGATTRSGGVAVANVLANDKFGTGAAALTNVRLTLESSGNPGVTLNLANGAVTVTAGTAIGTYPLVYRICEIANPTNCDQATVTVTVNAYLIDAVNDTARGSSKIPNTPLASVLGQRHASGRPRHGRHGQPFPGVDYSGQQQDTAECERWLGGCARKNRIRALLAGVPDLRTRQSGQLRPGHGELDLSGSGFD